MKALTGLWAYPIEKTYNISGTRVAVCTDLSDNAPHRKVRVDMVIISWNFNGVMVNILAQNASSVCSSPAAVGTQFLFSSAVMIYMRS